MAQWRWVGPRRKILVPMKWSPFEHLCTWREYHKMQGSGCGCRLQTWRKPYHFKMPFFFPKQKMQVRHYFRCQLGLQFLLSFGAFSCVCSVWPWLGWQGIARLSSPFLTVTVSGVSSLLTPTFLFIYISLSRSPGSQRLVHSRADPFPVFLSSFKDFAPSRTRAFFIFTIFPISINWLLSFSLQVSKAKR